MNIEKSRLWDDTTPFTDSERNWLTAQLKKEVRSQKEWQEINQLLRRKTVFSLLPQEGPRFEKYAVNGILYNPDRGFLYIGSNLKELELLKASLFSKKDQPRRFVVTVMSYQAAVEVAIRKGCYLMLDEYTSGSIRFISFSGQTGQVNATFALSPDHPDYEAILQAALRNGGRFA